MMWTMLFMPLQLKLPTAEYNPFECVKTNINGAMNLIDACIDKEVKGVVALSKTRPVVQLTCMVRPSWHLISCLWLGSYAGSEGTKFSVVRYGNVVVQRICNSFFYVDQKCWRASNYRPSYDTMISLEEGVSWCGML